MAALPACCLRPVPASPSENRGLRHRHPDNRSCRRDEDCRVHPVGFSGDRDGVKLRPVDTVSSLKEDSRAPSGRREAESAPAGGTYRPRPDGRDRTCVRYMNDHADARETLLMGPWITAARSSGSGRGGHSSAAGGPRFFFVSARLFFSFRRASFAARGTFVFRRRLRSLRASASKRASRAVASSRF